MVAVIIAQGIIFLVLIVILRQFMKGHVSGAVGHLQKMNDELMKQQASLKSKIVETERQYKLKMNQMNQDITKRQNAVREEANKVLDDAREGALKEKERIINDAVETRDSMRKEIMAEMEEKAIQHSHVLINESFSDEMKKLLHEQLMKEVIDGINQVDFNQFQIQTDTASLKSAKKLEDEELKSIAKVLQDKIGKETKIEQSVDDSLVAGFILKFGTFVIDGSLSNSLQDAAAKLKKSTAKRYQST